MRKRKPRSRVAITFALALVLFASGFALPARYRQLLEPTAFAAAKTFTVNVNGDGQDANPGDGVCQTSIVGNCSLRAAIEEANVTADKDTINFSIPGTAVHTISPNSVLPDITSPVIIDGYSQPGASANTVVNGDNAVLLIELNGDTASSVGLIIKTGNSTVQGLVINRFGPGIQILSGEGNTIQGNFIGTNPAGNSAPGNRYWNVSIVSNNNLVGGTSPAARNVISGAIIVSNVSPSGIGVRVDASGTTVEGNFIGTDASGTMALGNQGIGVNARAFNGTNVIGGTTAGARNIISGNGSYGIFASAATIQGNFIGTDVTGTFALGNTQAGVGISTAIVGGSSAAARNIISGNLNGVELSGSSNQVSGNFIGTDATGTAALSNTQSGIVFDDNVSASTIGGASGLGNTIAFNGNDGIFMPSPQTNSTNNDNAILNNSIFANGGLGIELGNNGVTPNDTGDTDSGANNLQNFPVISSATNNGSNTTVSGSLDSTPNKNFTIQFFGNPTCDSSGNGEGKTFVGSANLMTGANGQLLFSISTLTPVAPGHFITTTATDSDNNTSEFSQCFQVVGSAVPTIQFGQSTYSTFEDCTAVTVTVAREGDTSNAVSVDYATQSGTANDRADFNTAIGTLTFAPGETAKAFDILISEDSFSEGTESFIIALSNATGAALGLPATATIQIFDDSSEPTANPIDIADDFVCQHYHDFLNREDDSSGLAFWTNNITSCGADADCIQRKRVDTSAAFFISIEFQETGGFVIRVQRAAFGKKSEEAASRITYNQFIRDARQVGDGVVVGQPGFDVRLGANEQTYASQVVTSAAFINRYPLAQTADQYVDALFASAGATPINTERQDAINAFGAGGTAGRTAALRSVSDSNSVGQAEFTATFVLMQYFGYLRRDPTDAPDNNDNGYQFWLTKLNNFNGDFRRADMVKAFITSGEYRSRFGTH